MKYTHKRQALRSTTETSVRTAMIRCSAPDRARLIGSANRCINDSNFTNLLQNIDINTPKKSIPMPIFNEHWQMTLFF